MEMQTILGLIARHALSAAAGWLMSHGFLAADGSNTEAFIGIGLALASGGWSWWQKYGMALVDKRKAQLSNLHPDAIKAP